MSRHPMAIPGAVRLLPGAYAVGETLHIVVAELLDDAGYADTPANRAKVEAAMADLGRQIGAPVIDASKEDEG